MDSQHHYRPPNSPPIEIPEHRTAELPSRETALQLFDELDLHQTQKLSFGRLGTMCKSLFSKMPHKACVVKAYKAAASSSSSLENEQHHMLKRHEVEIFLRFIVYYNNFWRDFEKDGAHALRLDRADFHAAFCSSLGVDPKSIDAFLTLSCKEKGHITYHEFCTWLARNTCSWGTYEHPASKANSSMAKEKAPALALKHEMIHVHEYMIAGMPPKDIALQVFDELDTNRNQTLSHGDLGSVWDRLFDTASENNKMPFTHRASIMRAYHAADQNCDGMVTRDEFEAFLRFLVYYNNCWDTFVSSNGKHASKLNRRAFSKVATALGVARQKDANVLFYSMDDNHSNWLTYIEYCTWMARNTCRWHIDNGMKNEESIPHLTVHNSIETSTRQEAAKQISDALQCFVAKRRLRGTKSRLCKFQALVRMDLSKNRFQTAKRGYIRLQAKTRSTVARQNMAKSRDAATTVQKVWRGYLQGRIAQQMRQTKRRSLAATVIQKTWRGYKGSRAVQNMRLSSTKKCAAPTTIQRNRRRREGALEVCSIRWIMNVRSKASTTIQKTWRGYQASIRVKEMRMKEQAATTIQAAVRSKSACFVLGTARAAAILLQAKWRCLTQERSYSLTWTSICLLQGVVRSFLCVRRRQKQIVALRLIQGLSRGMLDRRCLRRKSEGALSVQKIARGRLVRKSVHCQHQSAIMIQTMSRQRRARRRFLLAVASATALQALARQLNQRTQYIQSCRSVVTLQRFVRRVDKAKKVKDRSAIVIQSWARSWFAQSRLRGSIAAVLLLQTRWRGACEKQVFVECREAALIVQSSYRRHLSETFFGRIVSAIVLLQRLARGRQNRRRFERKKAAAVTLQKEVRAYKLCKSFHKERGSSIVVQSWWRWCLARRGFMVAMEAATRIQTEARRFSCQKKFHDNYRKVIIIQLFLWKSLRGRRRKRAATIIQTGTRAWISRSRLETARVAVILIQSKWRSELQWQSYRQIRLKTILLQALIRCFLALKRRCKMTVAVTRLQASYRARYCRKVLAVVRRQEDAATLIQCETRAWKARTHYVATRVGVILIQSHCRRVVGQQSFCRIRRLILQLQAMVRCFLAVRRRHRVISALITFQVIARGALCRKQLVLFCCQDEAARVLQSHARGWVARSLFKGILTSAIRIQSVWRSALEQRAYCRFRNGVVGFQASVRSVLAVKLWKRRLGAFSSLQAIARGVSCRQELALANDMRNDTASMIQAQFRGKAARDFFTFAKVSVILIQTNWRRARQEQAYQCLRFRLIRVQAIIRSYLHLQRQRRIVRSLLQSVARGVSCRQFLVLVSTRETAATRIQSNARSLIARSSFQMTKAGAISIQSKWRSLVQTQSYEQFKLSLTLLQACVRGFLALKHRHRAIGSVTKLQAIVRGVSCRQNMKRSQTAAATTIQSMVRCHISSTNYMTARTGATLIQARWRSTTQQRSYVAVRQHLTLIQAVAKSFVEFKRRYRTIASVSLLQARARGASCRQNLALARTHNAAATSIQAEARARRARRQFAAARNSSILVQANWRSIMQRREYDALLIQIARLQAAVRRFLLVKRRHRTMANVTLLQAIVRGASCPRSFISTNIAATTIQAKARAGIARSHFNSARAASAILQSKWRALVQQRAYCSLRGHTMRLQAIIRSFLALRRRRQVMASSLYLQATARGVCCRQKISLTKTRNSAAILVQAMGRALSARSRFAVTRAAALLIQAVWRRSIQRRTYGILLIQLTRLQAVVRGFLGLRRRRRAIASVTLLQAIARGAPHRREDLMKSRCHDAATLIQAATRAFLARLLATKMPIPDSSDPQMLADVSPFKAGSLDAMSLTELAAIWKNLLHHKAAIIEAYNSANKGSTDVLTRDEFEAFLRFTVFYRVFWTSFSKDGRHTSKMSRSDFSRNAASLGVGGDSDQAFDLMDERNKNKVSYEVFCTWMARSSRSLGALESTEDRLGVTHSVVVSVQNGNTTASIEDASDAPAGELVVSTQSDDCRDRQLGSSSNGHDPSGFRVSFMPSEKEAVELFSKLDKDHSGSLTFLEIEKLWKRLFINMPHKAPVRTAFKAADMSGDNSLSRDEFEVFLRFVVYYNACWNVFAVDGTHVNVLNRRSFGLVAKKLGALADANELFYLMDKDNNGFLSYEEFILWLAWNTCEWRSRRPAHAVSYNASDEVIYLLLHSGSADSTRYDGEDDGQSKDTPEKGESPESEDRKAVMLSREEALVIFEEFDSMQSQSLNEIALRKIWKRLFSNIPHHATAIQAFMAADENGDGVVTFDEFEVFLRFTVLFNNLWHTFSKDGVHVSTLKRREFAELWSSLGVRGNVSDMFDAMDADSNNQVSYDEFCTFLARRTREWSVGNKLNAIPLQLDTCSKRNNTISPLDGSPSLDDNSVNVTPTNDGVEVSMRGDCDDRVTEPATTGDSVARKLWMNDDSVDVSASEEAIETSLSAGGDQHDRLFRGEQDGTQLSKRLSPSTRHGLARAISESAISETQIAPLTTPIRGVAAKAMKQPRVLCSTSTPPVDEKLKSKGSSRTSTSSPDRNLSQAKGGLVVVPIFMLASMPSERSALIVFDEYDKYGRKALSFDKMNKIWKILFRKLQHKIPVRKAFDAADLDRNGMVSRRELEIFCRCTIYYNNGWDKFVACKRKSSPWKSFTRQEGKLVTKHTKRLSRTDFRLVAPTFGVSDGAIDHVFDLADGNHSDFLNFDEFCFWLARNTCNWKMR